MAGTDFPRSKRLQKLFNEHFEVWRKKHRAGMQELAERAGVSASYLSHVGRYGRIPGKPTLVLLAFNFELPNPQLIFDAAGLDEAWPYESGVGLADQLEHDPGLLSVKLDMSGFTDAVRQIVRSETGPRSIQDLTRGKPLRVGMNLLQAMLFQSTDSDEPAMDQGFFPAFLKILSISLQCRLEIHDIHHTDYLEKLHCGDLDLYGPVFSTFNRTAGALYSAPFCQEGLSVLGRVKKTKKLEDLSLPEKVSDIRKRNYQVAVLLESQAHHFAKLQLGIPDERLVVCETGEEALERVVLAGITRPAHLAICDSNIAISTWQQNRSQYKLLFAEENEVLTFCDNAIAVRADWPELLSIINEGIAYLTQSNTLTDLFWEHVPDDFRKVTRVPQK